MKYFIDTEFLEGPQKAFFGKTKPTIDLISIGMVDENNREYYAISKEFNLKEAWNRHDLKNTRIGDNNFITEKVYWIRENVLKPIFDELNVRCRNTENLFPFDYKHFKILINNFGKTNIQIANEICEFIYGPTDNLYGASPLQEARMYEINDKSLNPEFYAYFADYDWVVFCWIFGKMMDLPKGFPMYCIDLKQILDKKAELENEGWSFPPTFDDKLKSFKNNPNYPKQSNEHNALADAKWNKELYEFLK